MTQPVDIEIYAINTVFEIVDAQPFTSGRPIRELTLILVIVTLQRFESVILYN